MIHHKTCRADILVILAFVVTYNLLMDVYCLRRYQSYNAGAFDLGIAAQTIWNTSQGDILHESVNSAKPASRPWHGRWEVILIPIALLYRIFSSVEFILILQTFIISLGIIPVYLLAGERSQSRIVPASLSLAYILNPVIHNPNLFDFHSVSLSISLIIFLIYFTERENRSMMIVMFFLILSCREDLAPLLFAYSMYLYIRTGRIRLPLVFLSLSLFWFLFTTNTPLVRSILGLPEITSTRAYTGRWDKIGGTNPVDIVSHFLDNPMPLVGSIFNGNNLKYLIRVTAPFFFLPLLNLKMTFIALPNLLINSLSSWGMAHHIEHHYNAHVGAVMMISTVFVIRRITSRARPGRFFSHKTVEALLASAIVLSSLASAFRWSKYSDLSRYTVTDHHEQLNELLKKIDPDASISSHFLLLDHVTNRKELYMFADNVNDVDYVIYDLRLPYNRIMTHTIISNRKVDPINTYIKKMINNRNYGIESYDDGMLLFRRGNDWSEGIERLVRAGTGADFKPVNITTNNGTLIESMKYHGILGAENNVASYTVICSKTEHFNMKKCMVFLMTNGTESFPSTSNSLESGIHDEALRDRTNIPYRDEINIRIPRKLEGQRISLYVLGDDLEYHYFDSIGK